MLPNAQLAAHPAAASTSRNDSIQPVAGPSTTRATSPKVKAEKKTLNKKRQSSGTIIDIDDDDELVSLRFTKSITAFETLHETNQLRLSYRPN
jgi:hypothetical protein